MGGYPAAVWVPAGPLEMTMSGRESEWPRRETAPRCARCGQPHWPAADSGRFTCGNCGRPLVSRTPRAPGEEPYRWLTRRWLLIGAAAVVILLLQPAPWRKGSRHAPARGGATVQAGYAGETATQFWLAESCPEEQWPLARLADEIAQSLPLPKGQPDTYGRQMQLGTLCFVYGIRVAEADPAHPRPRRNDAAPDEWMQRMAWHLEMARFMARHPVGGKQLEQAESAFARAAELGNSQERRALATRSRAYVRFARGDFQGAWQSMKAAEAGLGEDSRLRLRCLYGIGRVEAARELWYFSYGIGGNR